MTRQSAESVSALTAEVAELKKATEDLGAERAALLTKYNDAVINIEKEQSLADELRFVYLFNSLYGTQCFVCAVLITRAHFQICQRITAQRSIGGEAENRGT